MENCPQLEYYHYFAAYLGSVFVLTEKRTMIRRIDEMQKYRYLDHGADIKIKSTGKSLDEAYEHMGVALCNTVVDTAKLSGLETKKLRIKETSITSTLYAYLNELLRLIEKEHFFIKHIYYLAITPIESGFCLTCELCGDTDSSFANSDKPSSVTYAGMSLELMEATNEYEVTVVITL